MTNATLKSKVFTTAWKNFRNQTGKRVKSFATCLKSSWGFWKNRVAGEWAKFTNLVNETEKAICVEVALITPSRTMTRNIWVPKSLTNNGSIATWFVQKKASELVSDMNIKSSWNWTLEFNF